MDYREIIKYESDIINHLEELGCSDDMILNEIRNRPDMACQLRNEAEYRNLHL